MGDVKTWVNGKEIEEDHFFIKSEWIECKIRLVPRRCHYTNRRLWFTTACYRSVHYVGPKGMWVARQYSCTESAVFANLKMDH